MTRRLLPCAFVAFVAGFGSACDPTTLLEDSNAVLVLTGLDDDELLVTLRIQSAPDDMRTRELSLSEDDARDDDTVVNVYYELPVGTHDGSIEVREFEDNGELDDSGACGTFQFVITADTERDTEAIDVDRLEDCDGDDDDDDDDDDDR
jgi:hypothetical protein